MSGGPKILDARSLLEKLVGFHTVSSQSNLELIDFVDSYLTSHGILCHRVSNTEGTKDALFAQVGPKVEGGVVLSGHSDVVPVEGQHWSSDPFTLTERDGKLFGRGTCDMKGFLALSLEAMVAAGSKPLVRPLQIAISYDEEIGLTGAGPLIEALLASDLPKAGAVIVGEPTMLDIVTAHNGGFGYEVHVHGFEVHSSIMHKGVSAVMMGARLIEWANMMNDRGSSGTPGGLAASFDPPFTTIHVGTISGGTALNITAKDCEFVIDFRVVPGDDFSEWIQSFETEVARLEAQMKQVQQSAGISIKKDFHAPGLIPEDHGAAERLAKELTGSDDHKVVSFMTEGGLFQERGYSTVVCGPGDIAQAHQPDEYISQDQFARGKAFMDGLVETLKH